MSVRNFLGSLMPASAKALVKRSIEWGGIEGFAFDQRQDVRADIESKYGASDLVDIYVGNRGGTLVHKWHHYFPVYERYFGPFRNRPVRFLEIGVSRGGSLRMWREYFGEQAIIYGIDIDEECRRYDGQAGRVRIGSQADPAFLRSVVAEMGGVDFILDDGSHHMAHIPVSLETLFPLLNDGGVYMIEDLHCAYWRKWGGGSRSPRNFFRYVGEVIGDMHRWYHGTPMAHPGISDLCTGVHVHDSIVVLDKGRTYRPEHSQIG